MKLSAWSDARAAPGEKAVAVGPGEAGGRRGGARGGRRRGPPGGGERRLRPVDRRPEGRDPRQPRERDALSLRFPRKARPTAEDARVRFRDRYLRRPGGGAAHGGEPRRRGISSQGLPGVGGGLRACRAEGDPRRGVADRDGALIEGGGAIPDAPAVPGGARGRDRKRASVRRLDRSRRDSPRPPPCVALRRPERPGQRRRAAPGHQPGVYGGARKGTVPHDAASRPGLRPPPRGGERDGGRPAAGKRAGGPAPPRGDGLPIPLPGTSRRVAPPARRGALQIVACTRPHPRVGAPPCSIFVLLICSSTSISAWVPCFPPPLACSATYIWWTSARPGNGRSILRASSRAIPISLTKCSTKNPGSKSRLRILGARFDSAQQPGGAAADGGEHRFEGKPRLAPVDQRLADADHGPGDHDLVAHLRVLPGPGTALADDRLSHRLEQGSEGGDGLGVASDHDGKARLAGSHIAAGDGSVHGVDVSPDLRRIVDLLRQRRFRGGHVHDDGPGPGGCQHAVRSEVDLPHIRGKADHAEHHVGRPRDGAGGVRPFRSLREEGTRLLLRAGVHGDVVPLREEVSAHRQPHHPGTDPPDARRLRRYVLHLRSPPCLKVTVLRSWRDRSPGRRRWCPSRR